MSTKASAGALPFEQYFATRPAALTADIHNSTLASSINPQLQVGVIESNQPANRTIFTILANNIQVEETGWYEFSCHFRYITSNIPELTMGARVVLNASIDQQIFTGGNITTVDGNEEASLIVPSFPFEAVTVPFFVRATIHREAPTALPGGPASSIPADQGFIRVVKLS